MAHPEMTSAENCGLTTNNLFLSPTSNHPRSPLPLRNLYYDPFKFFSQNKRLILSMNALVRLSCRSVEGHTDTQTASQTSRDRKTSYGCSEFLSFYSFSADTHPGHAPTLLSSPPLHSPPLHTSPLSPTQRL